MKSAFRRSVGFVWALGLASLLTASVVVPAQATATPVVDQQQTFYSPGMGHTSGQVAQTFTAGMTGVLDHVSLVTATNYGARITVEILNTGSNGAPTGAPLGTSTPQYLTCCAQWHDFTFSPAVQVTSGTRYAIVVPINSAYVTWWYMPSDPYPGGQMWVTFCPSCNWLSGMQYGVDYSTLDFAFETWVLSAGGANSAPTLTEAGSEAGAGEGTSPTMTGTFSDSDGDTVALTADKGTLTAPAGASSGAWSWTEPAADESPTQTVTVTATDSHGLAASVHFAVNIGGVAPAVRITSDPVSSPEGATVQLTGAATSPDAADNAGVFTFAWTVTKDGSPYATGSGAAWSFDTSDEGSYLVTLQATDDGGMTGSTSLTVTGTDITPTARITGTSVSPSLFVIPRENVSFSGSFSDAAAMDSHVATWDFGDGSNATENIVAGGSTDLNASHSYAAAGTYTVRLKVADDDGTAGVATTTLTVMTPQQALGLLASYVENLPGLNAGEKNSLLVKLNAASDALTRGDATAAGNELNAFLNELNADLSSGKVSRDSASVLSASVHVVQSALGTRNRFTDLWPLGL